MILIIVIGGFISYTLYSSYKFYKAEDYAVFNDRYCGQPSCHYKPDPLMKVPSYTQVYRNDIGKYCLNLICTSVENDTSLLPENVEVLKVLQQDEQLPIGLITTSSEEKEGTVWISFRGSQTVWDWINDFNFGQEKYDDIINVHKGFNNIYDQIKKQIYDVTDALDKNRDIIICGHSLGGAIAFITAIDLQKKGFNNLLLYTFASPKVGDKTLVDSFTKSSIVYYRVVNINDVVPENPPAVVPNTSSYDKPYIYYHCGFEKSFNINAESISANHSTLVYFNGLDYIEEESEKLVLLALKNVE